MSSEQVGHMIKMLNQIVLNLSAACDDEEAAHRACEHMQKFWSPSMKQRIAEYAQTDTESLSEISRRALDQLLSEQRQAAS